MERIGILIVAGGSGTRMGAARPKQFMFLDGQPLLSRTINAFAAALPAAEIVVVLPEAHVDFWRNLAARFDVEKHTVVTGGTERFHSVQNGLAAFTSEPELIGIHDGVRPLVTHTLIHRIADAAAIHGAAIPVVEPVDSFREIEGQTSRPIARHRLRAVQTPQFFNADLLHKAYQTDFNPSFTDDASVVEQTGTPVFLCEGERRNIKITTPVDLLFAESLLEAERPTETDD